jgi:uroporphyrinogen-III decarboxylase
MREKGLVFNEILQNEKDMAAAAMLAVEEGFDSTTLPFDMNVEAEILGGEILYHEEVDGHPVYPTMGVRTIQTAEDIRIPGNVSGAGRIPVILQAIRKAKEDLKDRAGVGAFIPGPFTLAGQVLNPEKMFVMVLKKPEAFAAILKRLTELLCRARDAYVSAGAEFVTVEEGGATTISPRSFEKLLSPRLATLFSDKKVPHALSLAGRSDRFIDLLLACRPDALGVDQECDLATVVKKTPAGMPLFCICGAYDMMAKATPEVVREAVRRCLITDRVFPLPPADIYPPAKPENTMAFIETAQQG